MSKQLKAYAISVSVKPKPVGAMKCIGRAYHGISMAESPKCAKEQVILSLLDHFKEYDGSGIKKPLINRDCITINSCKLHDDFKLVQKK
ncbi:MAG: hypothetical protein A2W90_18130 [Bacteroidetes bacterium GWF2_42_66]|nr:MAG: hypothetical protein A2W92_06120 [Bacteroidetes bacterium GWA2_42_15]OFX98171.1 MAG: hypothetical protein A2W89_09620 [Bacteroidetes bacterium GWE2_42_39]OFY42556.1 MAG: hypothetical protein A2W90_18130 [Bacteroidetes bacterium GWF2_42_66]HBL74272.1 hypothetical protein [Prolixibacteraceae bacterium]HCU64041.1 hypothetical protein [Prolixibacteraceae bacterium]